MDHATTIKLFEHCRLIVGMVLSLTVARLLNGLARFVQHPKKVKVYGIHIGWVFGILVMLIHFWWWEFKLINVTEWTFEAYTLIILYAIVFFLLSSLLFPDQMDEYTGFEDYFMSRRKWFFGIFGLSFIIDFADTAIKGMTYFHSLGIEYPIRNATYITCCIIAMFTRNKYYHITFVSLHMLYQLSYIFRLYHTQ